MVLLMFIVAYLLAFLKVILQKLVVFKILPLNLFIFLQALFVINMIVYFN